MNLKEKRKMAIHLIEKMDESKLDAFLTLMKSPYLDSARYDNLVVSEDDWADAEYRRRQVQSGKVKMVPIEDALKRGRANLKK